MGKVCNLKCCRQLEGWTMVVNYLYRFESCPLHIYRNALPITLMQQRNNKMEELKLVKVLIVSLILQSVLLIPRLIVWTLGVLESIFRILGKTIKGFNESLKQEVIK
jgi:hypothetical protein